MRAKMVRVAAPADAIDIVGTGGDGHETYNVSTCAAFVVAACGVPVAKHGNRSVSSRSGASDVLGALGVTLDAPKAAVERAIADAGVGFLWAPLYHPAMKVWAPVRAELGVRSVFNLLGPLTNPASVKRQVVGVFARQWVEPVAHVLAKLGAQAVMVVHGHDGLDEFSTTGPTTVARLTDGVIDVFDVTPEDAGLPRATLADLKGGDATANAAALRAVLAGERGPYRDIVVMNSAGALIVAGRAATFAEGAARAAAAIDSGGAKAKLEALVDITRGSA
jgi:anthranilate phosphoribosyltransferase